MNVVTKYAMTAVNHSISCSHLQLKPGQSRIAILFRHVKHDLIKQAHEHFIKQNNQNDLLGVMTPAHAG